MKSAHKQGRNYNARMLSHLSTLRPLVAPMACPSPVIDVSILRALSAALLLSSALAQANDLAPPQLDISAASKATTSGKPPATPAKPTKGTATNAASVLTPPPIVGEPTVERTVVEDTGSRIEEVKVRGQTRSIHVQPKGGAAGYDIVPADPGRDSANGPSNGKSSAGQRVWSVLKF